MAAMMLAPATLNLTLAVLQFLRRATSCHGNAVKKLARLTESRNR
jgi:hypothetical protein